MASCSPSIKGALEEKKGSSSPSPSTNTPPPIVLSVTPSSGAAAGGTSITIAGTGFTSGASVLVGGSACLNVSVLSSTQITCQTPAHVLGAVAVTVVNPDAQTGSLGSGFAYVPAASANTSFAVVSGGGFSSGGVLRLMGTAGTIGNPIVHSVGTLKSSTGLQGALSP